MNIQEAIKYLNQVANIHPTAVVVGIDRDGLNFTKPATTIIVQTGPADRITRVYFEHDENADKE